MGILLQEEEKVEEPKAKRKRIEEAESTKQDTKQSSGSSSEPKNNGGNNGVVPRRIETGFFSKVPPELFHNILKFLSSEVITSLHWSCGFFFSKFFFLKIIWKRNPFNCGSLYVHGFCCLVILPWYMNWLTIVFLLWVQDLISCTLVCRFLNYAASDEALWRRLWVLSLNLFKFCW